MGYTYGAGDLPPKCPEGSGAVWMRATDPVKYGYWAKALQWDSAFQMQHMHDFLAGIEWWRPEPAPELIRNQPAETTRRIVLAKSAASVVAKPLPARWFDLVRGRYTPAAGAIRDDGTRRFTPPAKGDWVLLLQRGDRWSDSVGAGRSRRAGAGTERKAPCHLT
jgi:hypothetical protein